MDGNNETAKLVKIVERAQTKIEGSAKKMKIMATVLQTSRKNPKGRIVSNPTLRS